MKDDKAYKIVIIGVVVYVVVMLIIFLPGFLRDRFEKLYILSGDFIKIKYENGTWSNITNSNDYKMKEFKVYESGNYKGEYKLLFTNKFYLYDSNGKNISYDGQLFAYNGTMKLSKVDVSSTEMSENDKDIVQKAIYQVGVSSYSDLNLFQKVTLDIDKDGTNEAIYCINNYYAEEVPDKAFSIVFIVDNNEIRIIKDKVISSEDVYEESSYEINKILDVKEDKKYEIMIEQAYYSRPQDSCILLYNLSDKGSLIKNLCE